MSAVGAVPGTEGNPQASIQHVGLFTACLAESPGEHGAAGAVPPRSRPAGRPGSWLSALSSGRRCFRRASGFLVCGAEL